MFSDEEIEKIVKTKIDQDETLGDQVGGSGHLGNVSLVINEISKPKEIKTEKLNGWEITFKYTLTVVTEFTIYPDNPPDQSTYKKTIIIDKNGAITQESKKEYIEGSIDAKITDWLSQINDVNNK